jgi:hypothetical protein
MMWKYQGVNGDEVMVEHIMKVSLEDEVRNRTIQAHHVKLINNKKS